MKVTMTQADVASGVIGDCYCCPAALAVQRATGDNEANVYEFDYRLYVEVWCKSIEAPDEVREFVRAFDASAYDETPPPKPIEFDLPDLDSPLWLERCEKCREFFAAGELEDGWCQECLESAS